MTDLSILWNAITPVPVGKWSANAIPADSAGDDPLNFEDGLGEKFSASPEGQGLYLLRDDMNKLGDLAKQELLFRSAGGIYAFGTVGDESDSDSDGQELEVPVDAVICREDGFIIKFAKNEVSEESDSDSDSDASGMGQDRWRIVTKVPDLIDGNMSYGCDFSRPKWVKEGSSDTYSVEDFRGYVFVASPSFFPPTSGNVSTLTVGSASTSVALDGSGDAGCAYGKIVDTQHGEDYPDSGPAPKPSQQYPRYINGTTSALISFWLKDTSSLTVVTSPNTSREYEMGTHNRVATEENFKTVVCFPEQGAERIAEEES